MLLGVLRRVLQSPVVLHDRVIYVMGHHLGQWRGEGGAGGYYKPADTKKKVKQNKIETQLKKRPGEKEEWWGYYDWLYRSVDKIMVVL
jgi:hypothetical protein